MRSDTNNSGASGAPQQQVVNGWHGNDLLEIQAEQNISLIEAADFNAKVQQRNGVFLAWLTIGVLGNAGLSAAADLNARRRP